MKHKFLIYFILTLFIATIQLSAQLLATQQTLPLLKNIDWLTVSNQFYEAKIKYDKLVIPVTLEKEEALKSLSQDPVGYANRVYPDEVAKQTNKAKQEIKILEDAIASELMRIKTLERSLSWSDSQIVQGYVNELGYSKEEVDNEWYIANFKKQGRVGIDTSKNNISRYEKEISNWKLNIEQSPQMLTSNLTVKITSKFDDQIADIANQTGYERYKAEFQKCEAEQTAGVGKVTATPPTKTNSDAGVVAVITTSEGVMVVEFYPDVAPNHVANFEKLARSGFYDGTAFHRVIPGFMIQGGDPNTKNDAAKDSWGMGGPGWSVIAEFNSKHHARGILSMARSQDPNSAGSQFFICHGDAGFLDGQYTVFGNLIKGFDVLDKIATTPTEAPDRPIKRVNIDSIKIVPANSVK